MIVVIVSCYIYTIECESHLLCNYSIALSTQTTMKITYDGITIAAKSLIEFFMCISFCYIYNIESQSYLPCKSVRI